MSYRYTCFGLNIHSEIYSPLLASNENSAIDVQIKFGKVPQQLSSNHNPEAWCQANPKQLLLKIQDVASFFIENGETITIDPQIDDQDYINVYLLGSAMGGLLHQRGYLVLHANGFVIHDQAVLVAAPQGFGKSTLAAAFLQKGFSLLADDVCAIKFNNKQPIVYPSYPQIKLCSDVLGALGYKAKDLKAMGYGGDKYYVPIKQNFHLKSVPLSNLIILDKIDQEACVWEKITGHNKLKTLLDNTYRYFFLELQGLAQQYFNHCTQLISNTPLFRLSRPAQGFSAFTLVEEIATQLTSKEN